jgi:DNA mismatch repair protein MutL
MAIRELDSEVIAQIAAGEVVTRAADAVKELVENAIDAVLARGVLQGQGASSGAVGASDAAPAGGALGGATRIGTVTIDIRDGGYTRIEVADDGCGIAEAELGMALRRHATSKINAADDLERVGSLGFRGEALAAIAAVADVTITSATADAPLGATITACNGGVVSVQQQARRPGTTVLVERLFERVPARRKFQRAASAETSAIGQLVQGYALTYPEIAFTVRCDGRIVLRTAGTGDLHDVAGALYGPEAAQDLVTVRDERAADDGTLTAMAVSGIIGLPSLHRATRSGIVLSVNRRPIANRWAAFAIEQAYETQLPVGRHPIAILDLTIPPAEVDVNVHPTKHEVRVLRDRLAFSVLQRSVRSTLTNFIGMPRFGDRFTDPIPVPEDDTDGVEVSLFGARQPNGASPAGDEWPRPRLGALRILGQVALTYIICEGKAGMYLVDQHAAHERVMLERLEADVARGGRSQLMLDPVVVELPRVLRAAADDYVVALRTLGFDAELFGDADIVVRAVPAALRPQDLDRVLRETHEALDEEGVGPDWRHRLAILFSCKTAVKAGQRLEIAEMQALLEQLDETTLCATCSHGRPTAILLSHSQLEREFGRR